MRQTGLARTTASTAAVPPARPSRRARQVVALLAILTLAATGCDNAEPTTGAEQSPAAGDQSSGGPSASASAEPEPSAAADLQPIGLPDPSTSKALRRLSEPANQPAMPTEALDATLRSKNIVGPSGVVVADGTAWVTAHRSSTVTAFDAETLELRGTVRLPSDGGVEGPVAVHPDGALICLYQEQRWARIDPQTLRVTTTVDRPCSAAIAGTRNVWMLSGADVMEVDPRNAKILNSVHVEGLPTAGQFLDGVQVGGHLFLSASGLGLLEVDPRNGSVIRSWAVSRPGDVTTDGRRVFVTDPYWDELLAVDTKTGDMRLVELPGVDEGDPFLQYGGGSLWVSTGPALAIRLDPTTLQPTWAGRLEDQDYFGVPGIGSGAEADRLFFPTYGNNSVAVIDAQPPSNLD